MTVDFASADFWVGVVAVGLLLNIIGAFAFHGLRTLNQKRGETSARKSAKRQARIAEMVADPNKLAMYRQEELSKLTTATLFFVQALGTALIFITLETKLYFLYVIPLLNAIVANWNQFKGIEMGGDLNAAELKLNHRAV